MKRLAKKFYARSMLVFLETLAVIFVLLLLVGGGVFWRLQQGPIDLSFAKEHIEGALNDPDSGYHVKFDYVTLSWPRPEAPLALDIRDFTLFQFGESLVHVDEISLGLAGIPLLLGQLEPSQITVRRPALHFIRDGQGQLRFGLAGETMGEDTDEAAADAREDNSSSLTRIIHRLTEPAGAREGEASPLDYLQSLEIEDARMVMEDHILGMTWFLPQLDLLFTRQEQGLVASAALELPGGRDGAASVRADVVYNRDSDDFRLQAHIQDFDPHIVSKKIEALSFLNKHNITVNGDINAHLTSDMTLKGGEVSLRSDRGYLALDDVYDGPLPYEALVARARYDKDAGKLDIQEISLTAKGTTLAFSSDVTIGDKTIKAPVMLRIPDLPQHNIAPLWPAALQGEPIEEWLLHKLSGGRLHDIEAKFNLSAQNRDEEGWQIDAQDITVDFDIENMDIDYRPPLMPVKQATGHGHFSGDILNIAVSEARLSDLTITDAQVAIDHIIAAGTGTADVKIALNGPLPTVFSYVGPEPIGMDESKLGFDPAAVKGNAALNIDLSFPTSRDLKTEEVKVGVEGTLTDVFLPDVVKTMDLTGGPLQLKVGEGLAELKGQALLAGYPVTLGWAQQLESAGKPWDSRITAQMKADETIRQKLGLDLSDWVKGALPVDVVYTSYNDGRAHIDVKADVTPVILLIEPFDFEKPVGVTGQAQCQVLMKDGHVQKLENLMIDSIPLKLEQGDFFFKKLNGTDELTRGTIKRARFGENDLGIEFEIVPEKAGLLKLAMSGAFMDAQPFLKDEDNDAAAYDGPPVQASIDVAQMRTHPQRGIKQGKIYFDMSDKGELNQLEMDGVAGKGAIYFRFKPDESGKMTVRLEADDAGATLRAFGLYDNVQGGSLVLYGQAPNRFLHKHLKGHVQLSEFHVSDAPVLARLVSGIDPTGFSNAFSGEGLYFSRLESDFDWYIRGQGDLYLINDGRTSGSSLGLTFDGKIDKAQKQTDITGTIIPMSMINQFVSNIPIIGDILAGGRGGAIFAATYTIKGHSDNPDISVNPLSVLTPGILRKVLFEEEVEK